MTREEIQILALGKALDCSRGTLVLSGGVGKTLIGLQHMDKQSKHSMFLVVAPKKSIFESWKDDAIKFKYEHLLSRITFTTYLSLSKQKLDYSVIYLDKHLSIAI